MVEADYQTQKQRVLKALQDGIKLSSRDAVVNYGIQDLPKRISELKREGYEIFKSNVSRNHTHWCVYWMDV